VCFATPQNGNWVIRATAGQLKSEVGLSFPMERGIIGRAFRTGQTQLLVDVSADPAYLGQDPALKSMLTVPILQGSHVLAVLNLEHTEPAAFGPEEQKLAESLAEALALGMENARLFEAAQVELARRQQIQAQISASLEEKVILLKEIHHRVKNNLQVISSLLDLQANQSKDPYTLEMFKDSQNRVKSMALIHEQLYQSDDLSRIDFGQYLNSLVNQLRHSYNTKAQQIVINLDATHVPLTIETAIPCGLIVNELVSNAFKYAFPEGHPLPHEITIKLSEISPNKLVLCIFDNGVGLPPGIDLTRAKTLGLRLVNNLVRQIKGQIQIHRNGGTRLDITFNL
jgi:two-component sensor histidine kinase